MYLEVSHATKRIGPDEVLKDVTFSLEKGTICSLIGSNGAGKSMLMKAICGLILLTDGSVAVDGKVIGRDISFPPNLGAMIERPGLVPQDTGWQNLRELALIRGRIGDPEIEDAMKRTGIYDAANKKFRKYSMGMKQRLGIAAAIMEKPDLLVLDEPFNALDEDGCHMVHQIIHEENERGALIILAGHEAEDLESVSDIVLMMKNGQVTDRRILNRNQDKTN